MSCMIAKQVTCNSAVMPNSEAHVCLAQCMGSVLPNKAAQSNMLWRLEGICNLLLGLLKVFARPQPVYIQVTGVTRSKACSKLAL